MKVSIITPSFNQAQFLERTMRSVLDQPGDFELEYIVVDGASTDGSVDLIKRAAAADSRMQWVSEPDQGQSDAINKGLRMATGDVVAFLNSDDVYYPGALAQVAKTFSEPSVQWAYGQCRVINEDDQEIARGVTAYKNRLLKRYRYWLLLVMNYISQPATFWRRSLLTEIGLLNVQEHLVMDYEYWCRLGQHYPATVIPAELAGFRLYATSKSGTRFVQQFQDEYRVAKQFTHNPVLLGLHKVHASLVRLIYRFLR